MTDISQRFRGKVALVTGSSRGIGKAMALQLAREGADVALNYRQRAEEAEQAAHDIQALGRRAIALPANMAKPEDITQMFEVLVKELGGLDFLICNAAAGMQGTLLEATLKSWELAMNVNARSYLLCAQAAFPLMKARGGGRMLALTAQTAVEKAFPFYGTVAASKAAIGALTTYLAVELAPHGITVNAISPGMVDTEALHYFKKGSELLVQAKAMTPTGGPASVDDVAHLCAFLCSDEARQINGQIIKIDGGYDRLFF
jgi:enoyl-[acyl-carrier protein] reductase III